MLCLTAPVKPFQILTPHKHDDINMLLCLSWLLRRGASRAPVKPRLGAWLCSAFTVTQGERSRPWSRPLPLSVGDFAARCQRSPEGTYYTEARILISGSGPSGNFLPGCSEAPAVQFTSLLHQTNRLYSTSMNEHWAPLCPSNNMWHLLRPSSPPTPSDRAAEDSQLRADGAFVRGTIVKKRETV